MVVLPSRYRPDGYTRLLLHCNGADAATTTNDMSRQGHAITLASGASLDTAQKKFGASSLLLADATEYLSVADSNCWNFGTENFTIDTWFRINDQIGESEAIYIMNQYVGVNSYQYFLYWDNSGTKQLLYRAKNTDVMGAYTYDVTLTADTWYHIAFVRNATTGYIFLNGNNDLSTEVTAFATNAVPDLAAALVISNAAASANGCWFDEYRISKGIARWTADFTPPTIAYR